MQGSPGGATQRWERKDNPIAPPIAGCRNKRERRKFELVKRQLNESIIDSIRKHADMDHHLKASILLGLYYYIGLHGLPHNKEAAIKYFTIGSSKGNPWCSYWLAQLFKSDIRERPNALRLFELARSRGIDCGREATRYSEDGLAGDVNISRPNEYYFYI